MFSPASNLAVSAALFPKPTTMTRLSLRSFGLLNALECMQIPFKVLYAWDGRHVWLPYHPSYSNHYLIKLYIVPPCYLDKPFLTSIVKGDILNTSIKSESWSEVEVMSIVTQIPLNLSCCWV